ncbi:Glucan elongating glucanosyltransferase 3 [Hyphodiscus hymeniophilus]|uniref:1,3-beta-glucanosyltransferase n=1 Tax=Hyphodiscus hymeniophilus TaxID=353542 RepID=A0A9P6VQT0_9HELO|nr:Glucan elongating glucanosyltransferase 3 [Hyphodiscus hymeniophilus]
MISNILSKAGLLAAFAVNAAFAASSVPTISAVGSKFFYSNGTQYFIKGIAYQLTEADPLIDTAQCQRDATVMATLGTNAIRVYHVDPSGSHSGCMTAFADAGIYLIVDLDTFNTAIDPTVASWNQTQFNAYAKVMDAFAPYDNTLGFFVGNEVIALANQSLAAPYIKAAARDLKAYRSSKGYREIPVGYSAADISELRPMLQNYLACGTNASESIDMFGLNAYEWCGDKTLETSGYSTLNTYAQDYNVPIFFSETGCNTVQPRTFEDQSAIFGSAMNDLWSGAIIYEWIEEANNYGLISYGPSVDATIVASGVQAGFSRTGTPTAVLPDFTNLQSQWATLTPTGIASSAYTTSITPPACPSSTAGGWLVDGDVKLPSVGQTQQVSSSGSAPSSTGTATSSVTGSAASASATTKKGGASGGKEIAGMSAGLVAVMLGFVYWL